MRKPSWIPFTRVLRCLLLLWAACPCFGAVSAAPALPQPYRVKDINPGVASSMQWVDVFLLKAVGRLLFFVADDGVHGRELWKSDGTPEGTLLVKDIRPGPQSVEVQRLIAVGGLLFFVARNGWKDELWRSDGTAAGTALVRTLTYSDYEMVVVNNALFFTDTENGRPVLGKISGGGAVSVIQTLFRPKGLAQSGGRLFFVITSSGGNGVAQLCRSDGTPGGTVRLKRVPVGTGYLAPLADVGGALFLIQSGSETSPRAKVLWKSDGTAGGTVPVRALGSSDNAVTWPTAAGSRLFFTADDGAHGYEMWVSDGTEAGTFMVRDIHPPESPSNNVVGPRWPIALGRNILFAADDGTHGSEPWHSDGTAAGTFLVKDIYPGPQPDWGRGPEFWTNVGGTVYFAAGDGSHGYELWRSDGTEAGTAMVKDIATGRADSSPMNMTNVNGRLFFSAADREGGRELWALSLLGDGTPHVEFAASGRTAPESTGRVAVTAILSWPSSRDVVVPFTLSGTATRGVDYSVTAGAIVIRAGATSGSATVTVDDDALDEEEESVVLTMGTPANARQGALAETRLIIADDDAAPSVQFETAGRRLREGSRAEITLRLSAPSGRLVTVPFTVSGAASPGLDYDLPAGPIAIPAGATTAALLLRGHVDSVKEPDETVVIALGTPTNATKGARDTYTATIAGP